VATVCVVVPVFNNEKTIEVLALSIISELEKLSLKGFLLLVDDGSSDNSWNKIREISKKGTKIHGIRLSKNYGQHAAINAGLASADADVVAIMDADLQEKPEFLAKILLPILAGECDICIGTIKESTRITSRFFHKIASFAPQKQIPITQRAFNKKVLRSILSLKSVNIVYGPTLENVGFVKKYVEVEKESRKFGESSYSFAKRIKLAQDFFATRLIEKSTNTLLLIAMFSLAFLIYALVTIFFDLVFQIQLAPGLNLIQTTILLGFSMIFLVLCGVSTIILKIYSEFVNSPRFLVSEET